MLDERLERVIRDILEKKPEFTKDQLMKMIEQKRASVGSGYLSSIGAALLVADDLNLDVSRIEQRQYRLRDIVPGLNGVSVTCYFLKSSSIKEFTRKDGTISTYRRSLIFDDGLIFRALEWDVTQPNNRIQFSPGEPIIIKNVLTRVGRDGKVELHMNSQSDILLDNERKPESLDTITHDISIITKPETSQVITGIIEQIPTIITFTKRDGKKGKALQFNLVSKFRSEIKRRVIIWSVEDKLEKLLSAGMKIRLVDIDSRLSSKNEIEFHGSEQTLCEILETNVPVTNTKENNNKFYLISVGPQLEGSDRRTALLSDTNNFYTLTLSGKLIELFTQITIGDILEMTNYVIKDGQIFVSYSPDNIKIVGSDEQYISHAFRKIDSIVNEQQPCIIEAVALSKAAEKVVNTKNGKVLQITQLMLGDETGEIEISGWGRYGSQLNGIMPGTRLLIYGAVPIRSTDGMTRLQCKEYTQIKRITV